MGQNIKATTGAGSSLYIVDSSPEIRVGQVRELKWPGGKQKTEDVTNQDSEVDANGVIWSELIGTIAEGGDIEMTMNYVPSDTAQRAFMAFFGTGPHDYELRESIDTTASPPARGIQPFSATMFESPTIDYSVDKARVLNVKLKIVGAPGIKTFS